MDVQIKGVDLLRGPATGRTGITSMHPMKGKRYLELDGNELGLGTSYPAGP